MKNLNKILILIVIVLSSALLFTFVKGSSIKEYSSKMLMCQDFATTYLHNIKHIDGADSLDVSGSASGQKWSIGIDIETDLYNLCLLELDEKAIQEFELSALSRYKTPSNLQN